MKNNKEEIKRLKKELKEWKSQEVKNRFKSVDSILYITVIKELEYKIKALTNSKQ